jgi:hypothetical protein
VNWVPRDVENDPDAARELKLLGLSTVPVTAVGDRYVIGYNPARLKELLDLPGAERWEAEPAELFSALDQLLTAVQAAVRQIPKDRLGYTSPDRDRTLRVFGIHIAHRVQRGLDAAGTLTFAASTKAMYEDAARPHQTPEQIATYAAEVQRRLRAWRAEAGHAPLERVVNAYNGRITLLQLFEMITNHTAHHLRQLYVFMARIGVEPRDPLQVEQLRGVTVLQSVF